MVNSYPDWRAFFYALALCAATSAAAQEIPIVLDAATTDFDRSNERLLFDQVSIERGDLGISADRAETSQLDFANSTWTFDGAVRIRGKNAEVTAQRAKMEFVDHKLKRATISGTPAVLSHSEEASISVRATEAIVVFKEDGLDNIMLKGDPAEFEHTSTELEAVVTRGSAGRLIYDFGAERITLANNAWVAQGDNEIRGEEIAYDIVAQRIVAGGDEDGDRVRITITPPADSELPEADEPIS